MKHTISQSSLVGFLLLTAMINPSVAQSNEDIERAGDILQLTIPLTAYGMTFAFDDYEGRRSFRMEPGESRKTLSR